MSALGQKLTSRGFADMSAQVPEADLDRARPWAVLESREGLEL